MSDSDGFLKSLVKEEVGLEGGLWLSFFRKKHQHKDSEHKTQRWNAALFLVLACDPCKQRHLYCSCIFLWVMTRSAKEGFLSPV